MISKWWWLCRQKFIVSWESSKLLLVHSYTFHTFYTFYIFAYTLPLGLLFSIHRQCFLRFQGIARTQGVPNTFMYFHIILNTWCFLHLLTLEILLTFSHFTLFFFLYLHVVSVVLCTVLMGRQQISLTWIKIPSGRVKRIWPHHTVCGGGIYIHHTGASKDIYTATTHCLNLKVTESRILYLLLNSIHQERPSKKQDKVWSSYIGLVKWHTCDKHHCKVWKEKTTREAGELQHCWKSSQCAFAPQMMKVSILTGPSSTIPPAYLLMCSCFRTALTLYKLWHAVAREQALHHLRGGAHPRP